MNLKAFLLVDIGNSRIKWSNAAIPNASLATKLPSVSGEMPTAAATPERIQGLAKEFPQHYLILASVVPQLTPIFCRAFKRRFHLVNTDSPVLGLEFDYPNPSEIGADRLAAAVAVQAQGKYPAIIVACGTATAFTVLDARGRLCGGVIAPGLQTQLASLLGATAQLPKTTLQIPGSILAKSSQEAIRAGVMLNFQGGAKEIINQLRSALPGRRKPHLILTGGNARYLEKSLDLPHEVRPLLVMEGLLIIGSRLFVPSP